MTVPTQGLLILVGLDLLIGPPEALPFCLAHDVINLASWPVVTIAQTFLAQAFVSGQDALAAPLMLYAVTTGLARPSPLVAPFPDLPVVLVLAAVAAAVPD